MAPEWEAAAMGVDLGMGIHHHHNTMLPPPPMGHQHFYGGGGGGGGLDFASSSAGSCFNLSFGAGDDGFSIPVPREEAAELEWLSNFVDDSSYPDMPPSYPPEVVAAAAAQAQAQQQQQNLTNSTAGARTTNKRSRPAQRRPSPSSPSDSSTNHVRRCTHCASERTPQWRTGPLGPKTLCNACGVRYKSGRLVPEYRPAASPTFVLTQHSNSHRKVMELRRQKDLRATSASCFPADYGVC